MRRFSRYLIGYTALLAATSVLSACDKVTDRADAQVSIIERTMQDTGSFYSDLFTYHPPAQPQAPQTRYCYQMMTDIVCYDSVQPGLTAKLVGYQDGEKISWVQPGGGSLGASGGDPVTLSHTVPGARVNADVYSVSSIVEATPIEQPGARRVEIK